ncbi:MAG TPA: OmpA family protein [Clostridiales bacterium]|nr:OmpA family protein [Clostridiales bacterium]
MSGKKKKKHGEEEGGEAWLLPYSDLMTLLLAMFIVLFAVSRIDEVKAHELANAFRSGLMDGGNGMESRDGDSPIELFPDSINPERPDSSSSKDSTISREELEKFLGTYELEYLEELKAKLEIAFKKEESTADMTVGIDMRGLVISLDNAILFDSGKAEIKAGNDETLSKLADVINSLDNYIRVEGHTDNVPIHTAVYPSNWELSTARAASVVRLFVEKCGVSPEKIVAVGYGEYKPVADNSTAEGRAKNRRIDIIILSEKYDNLEKQITD